MKLNQHRSGSWIGWIAAFDCIQANVHYEIGAQTIAAAQIAHIAHTVVLMADSG